MIPKRSTRDTAVRTAVAILAHNEEPRLRDTLDEVRRQTFLEAEGAAVEVVVVANGCSDGTVDVARRFIAEHGLEDRFRVVDIPEQGKTHAWNRFVRELAAAETEIFVFQDADISFRTPDTVERLIQTLRDDDFLLAACGDSLKDVEVDGSRGLIEGLSASLSRLSRRRGSALLCGQLYAIRAPLARRIHLPLGLVAEDGYLKHLLVSNGFKDPIDPGRIGHVPGVGNVFTSYRRLRDIIATQVRMRIGEVQIHVLLEDVRRKLADDPQLSLEELADEDLVDGPQWLGRLVDEHVRHRGWWVMFPGAMTNRLRWLARLGFWQGLRALPLALIGTVADVMFSLMANRKLKRKGGREEELWTQIRGGPPGGGVSASDTESDPEQQVSARPS